MSKTAQQLLRRPNDPSFLILTSLASGAKHGYALLKDVEDFLGVTSESGHALRSFITRLEELGLIEPLAEVDRRRPYRLTTAGAQVLHDVTSEMRRLADVGAARLRIAIGGAQ